MRLKPFFCYFGGKWRIAKKYPAPLFDTVIEPFAGAAGYSVLHYYKRVLLYDADPTICSLWEYLINVSESEIMRLPVEGFESTDDLHIPIESKYLIGFWLNKGAAAPCKRPSSWMRQGIRKNSFWGDAIRHRIASQVPYIRHWRVKNESYLSAPHEYATWFIDPPYQIAGKNYKHSFDDYASLGKWCRSRLGQTIVCEAQEADWLPFQPFCNSKASESKRGGRISQEVIWQQTNLPSIVMPT